MFFCNLKRNSGAKSLRCFFISIYYTMYCIVKLVDWCQCYMRGVALLYPHSSSDFLRYNYTPKVVNTAHNSRCFHIYKNLLNLQISVLLVSVKKEIYTEKKEIYTDEKKEIYTDILTFEMKCDIIKITCFKKNVWYNAHKSL